jgi:hypothetical protein
MKLLASSSTGGSEPRSEKAEFVLGRLGGADEFGVAAGAAPPEAADVVSGQLATPLAGMAQSLRCKTIAQY